MQPHPRPHPRGYVHYITTECEISERKDEWDAYILRQIEKQAALRVDVEHGTAARMLDVHDY